MPTGINYLDEVWNPVTGCSGQNCKTRDTCWAKFMVDTMKRGKIHGIRQKPTVPWMNENIPFNEPQFHPSRLDKPLHWRKPRRIGVCFMGDLFDEQVQGTGRDLVFLKMYQAYWHYYFILTKQIDRMFEFCDSGELDFDLAAELAPYSNEEEFQEIRDQLTSWFYGDHIFWGVSITDQEDADRMLPELLKIPGKHWVSIEPMMGDIDIENGFYEKMNGKPNSLWRNRKKSKLDWVVVGAHNKPKRYPCDIEWIRSVVEQCQAANVPVWVKQIHDQNGKLIHDINLFPKDLQILEFPNATQR